MPESFVMKLKYALLEDRFIGICFFLFVLCACSYGNVNFIFPMSKPRFFGVPHSECYCIASFTELLFSVIMSSVYLVCTDFFRSPDLTLFHNLHMPLLPPSLTS